VVGSEGLGLKACVHCGGKNIRNNIQYFLHLVLFFPMGIFVNYLSSVYCCHFMCICCILCVFVVPYMYLLYVMCLVVLCVYLLRYVCIVVLTLDAGLLARSQYREGSATGHHYTGFSWFPCVCKRMLRWFPSFQVATTCLSCSPPDLNSLVTFFLYLCTCKITTATG
jgi:hypothetical protein